MFMQDISRHASPVEQRLPIVVPRWGMETFVMLRLQRRVGILAGVVSAFFLISTQALSQVVEDTPEPAPAGGGGIGSTGPATPIYLPYNDNTIRFAEHCSQWLTQELFGWTDTSPSATFNLWLDGVYDVDNPDALTGWNVLNQSFIIEFGVFFRYDHPQTNNPSGVVHVAYSEAVLSSNATGSWKSVCVWGLYAELPSGVTFIPLISQVDQQAAMDDHELSMSLGQGFSTRTPPVCANLDEIARDQLDIILVNERAGRHTCAGTAAAYGALCSTIGLVGCWETCGVGCVVGILCQAAVLADTIRYIHANLVEWRRVNECLCIESAWRASHPGQSYPYGSCAVYVNPPCPTIIGLPVH